jgi:hypothetical protein
MRRKLWIEQVADHQEAYRKRFSAWGDLKMVAGFVVLPVALLAGLGLLAYGVVELFL